MTSAAWGGGVMAAHNGCQGGEFWWTLQEVRQ